MPGSSWQRGTGQYGTLYQKLFCVMKWSENTEAKYLYFSLVSVEGPGVLKNKGVCIHPPLVSVACKDEMSDHGLINLLPSKVIYVLVQGF